MNIKFTPEQIDELKKNEYLLIYVTDDVSLYFEFNMDLKFEYGEIREPDSKNSFSPEDFKKMSSIEPCIEHQWNGHIYRCPNEECDAPMIFKYDYCPKCGQAIKWKDGVEP